MIPQEIICQIVQIPIPRIIFDKKVVKMAKITAAPGPKINPQIIIKDVMGWTFGMKTKTALPTTPSAANRASKVILYVFN